jgi:hypothetical protein
MFGTIKPSSLLQTPYINVKVKVVQPGTTNGKPNIRYEDKYIVSPSAKKIATYIKNQIFGSDLVTQTEGLDINWLMPTLSEALEKSIYQKESFIYIHKFDNKVYLECLNKCDLHDLVQKYDKVMSATLIQEFETDKQKYELKRYITINNGTSTIRFEANQLKNNKDYIPVSIEKFNSIFGTDYKPIYNLPYEVLINIDIGQEFFKDSEKLLNEEMEIFNTIVEEVEKTKTRIVTTQHYQSGDIATKWQPTSNQYNVQQLSVGHMADYFTLLPGDKEHHLFQFLQGDIRIQQYQDTFKFLDYQVIQMAGLSPASFGYEKDSYQNVASVDLSGNASEMTVEAIKKQLEPQINKLIENIVKLQISQNMTENAIPSDLVWDYGTNEIIDDAKKINTLQAIQRTTSVPYSVRAKIITPILNKLIDTPTTEEDLVKEYQNQENKMNIEFGEI